MSEKQAPPDTQPPPYHVAQGQDQGQAAGAALSAPPGYNSAYNYGYNAGYNTQYGQQYGQPYGQPYGQQYANPYGMSQQPTVVVTQPQATPAMVNQVPDNMGLAIFTTICCCWPIGIAAILKAQDSRRALDRGDVITASQYSQESRKYSMIALGCGIAAIVVTIIIVVVIVVTSFRRYCYGC